MVNGKMLYFAKIHQRRQGKGVAEIRTGLKWPLNQATVRVDTILNTY